MALVVLGVNQKSAPAALRERVSVSSEGLCEACRQLVEASDELSEAVVLSTCNRTEVYACALTAPKGKEAILDFFTRFAGLDRMEAEQVERHAYFYHSRGAVDNLFKVVCSLDSMVLGEAQILGQTRAAFARATEAGTCGGVMTKLFKQALEVGKRARTETGIGQQSVSVSTVAVDMAVSELGSVQGRQVLVVGAGEMAELVALYLHEKGCGHIAVANRSLDKAQALAQKFDGDGLGLDSLAQGIAKADVVISSTGAPGYVITPELLEQAGRPSAERPLLMIDIALPRDIHPGCAELQGVTCYDIDGLCAVVDEHKQTRRLEAVKVEGIVYEEVDRFLTWMQERSVAPTIKEMYGKASAICSREVDHALRELEKSHGHELNDADRQVLEALANSVMKKILHGPVIRIRKQSTNPDGYMYTDAARFLFGLDNNPLGLPCGNHAGKCHLPRNGTCRAAQSGVCPFGRSVD